VDEYAMAQNIVMLYVLSCHSYKISRDQMKQHQLVSAWQLIHLKDFSDAARPDGNF
jgi:hypothetical protein